VISVYLVRPKADRDLDDQAYYLAARSTPELGHRFLLAAHETFALLASKSVGTLGSWTLIWPPSEFFPFPVSTKC